MNLSLRDLRAIVALMDERNFTRAAERVHLSQSAFSVLIRNLEQVLGARLFDRSTRNVVLTAEGRLFEGSARRLLADFEEMLGDFRDHAQRRKGRIAVAALPSLAAAWLPALLAEYHTLYPGIELAMLDAHSHQCLTLLRSGQVDLAIATMEDTDTDLISDALCSDTFHLIYRKDHPLAQQERIRVRDLAQYPFIHMSRNTSVRQHLEAAFRPVQMRSMFEVEHLASLAGLVEAGLGITVVPSLTLFHFRRPELVVRPLPLRGFARRLLLVQRKSEPLSAAAAAMHDLMKLRRPRPECMGGLRAHPALIA